jgi:hypothetical protein
LFDHIIVNDLSLISSLPSSNNSSCLNLCTVLFLNSTSRLGRSRWDRQKLHVLNNCIIVNLKIFDFDQISRHSFNPRTISNWNAGRFGLSSRWS